MEPKKKSSSLTSVEMCAGAGGQALGLEKSGFSHNALVELDEHACATLRLNRPYWNTLQMDLRQFSGVPYKGVDLLAGGVPCPPFSKAGKQLGDKDERNLFPEALRLVDEIRPQAVMLENVRGLLDSVFDDYREFIRSTLLKLGYVADWRVLHASDFGVPQLRPRFILVALRKELVEYFSWPTPANQAAPTVGEALYPLMAANGWKGAKDWALAANTIAPTLVGGSKKHGGPDLGPTRAKKAWAALSVEAKSLANAAPEENFEGMPRLTVEMAARIQGFPSDWKFAGGKTNAYRQVGNAFPPPVAAAVTRKIRDAIEAGAARAVSVRKKAA